MSAELVRSLDVAAPARTLPWRMHARHRVDISRGALLKALASCAFERDAATQTARLEQLTGGALATLSVRSAFDLLLEALAFRPGSELIMSAITIPDMARIAEAHGLKVVPVELDRSTLAPQLEALDRAVTPRTVAIVVAHLFGGRMDLDPVHLVARRHRLPLIEDCAQAFLGPRHTGDPRALASLFSFGTIKTCTALGGALAHVRDPLLLERMRGLHALRPLQPNGVFAARLARFLGLSAISSPTFFGTLQHACAAAGVDLDAKLQGAVKGFPGALLEGIRKRPSAPLLKLLAHRLETFDAARLERRAANGEQVLKGLEQPGHAQPTRTHWLVPFVSAEPAALISELRASGFDAGQGTTSLAALNGLGAEWLSRVVYLPAYPELPRNAVATLSSIVSRARRN